MKHRKRKGKVIMSFVLTLALIVSTFTGIVPGTSLTARATTYSENIPPDTTLQEGDILEPGAEFEASEKTIILQANGYCTSHGHGEQATYTQGTENITLEDLNSLRVSSESESLGAIGEEPEQCYYPYADGAKVDSWVVVSVEGNTITIKGYAETQSSTPFDSAVYYRQYNSSGVLQDNGTLDANAGILIESDTKKWTTGNTYVASGTETIDSRVTVTGTVNLILLDGASLTINGGIAVTSGNTLNIYVGSTTEGTINGNGALTATGSDKIAGIGSNRDSDCGTVNIHGGSISANGGNSGAGIGGGRGRSGGTVNIYGGTVTANGGENGAGIGGGQDGSGATVSIYGGTVTATGGENGMGIGKGGHNEYQNQSDGDLTLGTGEKLYGSDTAMPEGTGNTDKLATGDGSNYTDTLYHYMKAIYAAPVSYTVTFKVLFGSWDDGTTANKTVTLTGFEGDTLTLASDQIPAVGNMPNTYFNAGGWVEAPDNSTAITANKTYYYAYQGWYFRMGSYNGVPVDWFIAKVNSTGVLMLSKYVLKTSRFGPNGTYTESDIYKWLDSDAGGTFESDLGLTENELNLVRTVDLSGSYGDGTDRFIIPALDSGELRGTPYTKAGLINNPSSICSIYWLRTKRDASSARVVRSSMETVDAGYSGATYGGRGVRPMFYLDTTAMESLTLRGSGTEDDPFYVAVAVTGVSLNKENTKLTVGGTETLTATVLPSNAADKSVSWSSDNESIATVDSNGLITAVSAGTTNINVTTTNGSKTATCAVTVKNAQTITAADVTATYGDMDKTVSVTINGDGALSYVVKSGSDVISVDDSSGALTIKKIGSAVVTVTASETSTYAQATKDVTVTVNPKAMTASTNGFSGYYDGQPHGITVNVTDPISGYTVKYGTEEGTYNLDTSPTQTEVGTLTVYYQVTAENYITKTGSATVSISPKQSQTITAANVTATYGDMGVKIDASVTTGNGTLSYEVKSGDAVTVDASGNLTIVKAGTAVITVTVAETDTYAKATKDVNVTVNTKTMTVNAEDVNVTVDGQSHGITVNVTDPAMGYTVKYGTEEGTYTLDASPTQTDVGTKTVYYQVTADNYTTYTGSAKVTVSAKQTQTITVSNVTATYGNIGKKVTATTDGNGAISYAVKDGSVDYIDVDVSTGTLTIKKVPADGKAYVTVTAAETATYAQASKDVTVTISKASAVAATVTANNRTYDGTEKPLVTVTGEQTGGIMYYALGTDANNAPADNLYTTSIPVKTNAGTYYVWYKVIGDENHSDYTTDEAVLVEIEADTTAPTGEISIDTNKWTSFLNTITFGYFFKETKDVTITAEDDLTGVEKIEYYVSDQALTLEQVKAVTEWTAYDSAFKLNPEKKYVVYARLTDKAGNTGYISSDGLVFVNLPVGYVTDIGTDSAKLNMKLSDSVRSEIKAAGFEYKKKADADTAWTKVTADSVAETVTKEITSLVPGTDYVFRPYVTYKDDSTDTGAEQNFTTDTKPAVTGSIAVKVKNETDGTKDVIVTIEEGNYALASQEKDGIAANEEVTTGKFKELPDGTYNIVIKSKDGEFVETKMITIADGAAEEISFIISKGEMKTDVEVEADTPKVAVDGLSKEELVQSGTITSEEKKDVEEGKISLEVTLKAEKKEESAYQTAVEKKAVEEIKSQMANASTKLVVDVLLDLSLFKTVTQLTGEQAGDKQKTDIGSTNTKVLEIAVPYDTTIKGLMVYRYHGSVASALKKLSAAPAKGAAYEDGSFYLSDKYIHIFASGFSTYAIAKEKESGSGGGGGTTPVTPGKTTPAKPSAPVLDKKTDTTITVKTVAGQEYSIDGGKTWQASGTFTGLTPETEYSIVTKITETSTANESPVSDALKVTTDKKADTPTPTPSNPGSTTNPTDKPTETPGSTTTPTDKPTETPGSTIQPTDTPGTTPTPGATSALAEKVTKKEKAAAKLSLNAGLKVSQTGKKVTVKWGKVSKADRYVVYAAYCGPDQCTKIKALSGSKTSMTFTKLNGSKLNLKKNIKVYVVAYRKVNGKETKLARSITAHIVGSENEKYTNIKKIKLSKSKYTLKVNKTATIKAEIVLEDKKKKQLSDSHAPEFRYASSNTKVAIVDENGMIKAVGKGTCYIYVYAKNGYAKKIKVTVK